MDNQEKQVDDVDDKIQQIIDKNTVSNVYVSKATPKSIKFCSRISVKIQDNFYTVEYGEEREIQDFSNVNLDKERQLLIDDCNNIVDKQAEEIYKTFMK